MQQDIENNFKAFLETSGECLAKQANHRYRSFDYCYNYFYPFYKNNKLDELANEKNLEKSCLQIGFYLASWGMMRGSSFLLKRSSHHYAKLIKTIADMDTRMWEIDVDDYSSGNIDQLIECKESIIKALGPNNSKTWDNKVSKIMLGVFGNVPAYDRNFKKFLKKNDCCQTFNRISLEQIKEFYDENKDEIDKFNDDISTINFIKPEETDIHYTKAKIIDMYGFIEGKNYENKKQ